MRHWPWDEMIEANRGRLIGLLAGMFAMLGSGDRVTRVVWRQVLARLVPMESALRRLICVAARDLTVTIGPARAGSKATGERQGSAGRAVFALTDTMRDPDPKRRSVPTAKEPRILSLDEWVPREGAKEPADDDLLDASALLRRLEALKAALNDLPAQALRLARWMARNERTRENGTWRRFYAIRSGRPPGHRQGGKQEVDEVLANCHDLALRCRDMVEREQRSAG